MADGTSDAALAEVGKEQELVGGSVSVSVSGKGDVMKEAVEVQEDVTDMKMMMPAEVEAARDGTTTATALHLRFPAPAPSLFSPPHWDVMILLRSARSQVLLPSSTSRSPYPLLRKMPSPGLRTSRSSELVSVLCHSGQLLGHHR